MSHRIVHMCVDIEGLLRKGPDALHGLMRDPETGRTLSTGEAFSALVGEVRQGRRVLPLGPLCEGFSYETGCPGHAVEPATSDEAAEALGHRSAEEVAARYEAET